MPETAEALQELRERVERKSPRPKVNAKHLMKWEAMFQHIDAARKLFDTNPSTATEEIAAAAEWAKKWTGRSREETSMGITVLNIIERDVMGCLKANDLAKLDGAVVALRRVVQREAFCGAVRRAYTHLRRNGKRPGDTVRQRAIEDAIDNVAKELSLRRNR